MQIITFGGDIMTCHIVDIYSQGSPNIDFSFTLFHFSIVKTLLFFASLLSNFFLLLFIHSNFYFIAHYLWFQIKELHSSKITFSMSDNLSHFFHYSISVQNIQLSRKLKCSTYLYTFCFVVVLLSYSKKNIWIWVVVFMSVS